MTASILVVDDAREMQEILYHSLASEGFQVVTAGNGEDAVGRLEAREFDVIVTDLVLPGCDGLEVLERARLLDPRAVVILMTGYASLGTAITALRRGANDYLEKPFPLDELTLRVRRLLQHRDVVGRERLQQRALNQRPTGHDLIGDSGAMRSVREQIARSALTRRSSDGVRACALSMSLTRDAIFSLPVSLCESTVAPCPSRSRNRPLSRRRSSAAVSHSAASDWRSIWTVPATSCA